MKVIINSPKQPRKEYNNLPEREPHHDLLKKRIQERARDKERLGSGPIEVTNAGPERATFTPADDAPETVVENRDILADMLSDGGGEAEEQHIEDSSWKNSKWVPALLLIAVGVLGGVWYFATHFEKGLPLERVTVEGAHMLKEQAIVQLAEIDRDQKFYKIDLKQIELRLLKHSLIKSVAPRREVNPATIVLHIEERQPVAMLRSESTGEAYIIDRDGVILRPKVLSGLRDPSKLLQVPLISGISEKDSASYRMMAGLITMMESIDSGVLKTAIGELRRTPTGAYVIYTAETQTPIFIGTPNDAPFHTALEDQRTPKPVQQEETHFVRQLHLLAKMWKRRLQSDLRSGSVLYVDARFSGQLIVKPKNGVTPVHSTPADSSRTNLLSVNTGPAAPGHR